MILFFLILGIVMIVSGIKVADNFDFEFSGVSISVIGGFIAIISVILYICCMYAFMCSMGANDKLILYQEENKVIEEQVNQTVSAYMQFEKDTYTDLKLDDPTFVVSLYPELKSNELVSKQLEIYVANKEKIQECKEQIIMHKIYRKWLFLF